MKIFYQLGIYLYYLGICLAALIRNEKARLWLQGRRHWQQKLKSTLRGNQKPVIWIHASSLGEFEMVAPLLQKLKEDHFVLISFFSPSGFEVIKRSYPYCVYLPLDTARNARLFIARVNPVKVIFVKYDLWYHYLHELSKQAIPTYLITALFREKQWFFSGYGSFMLKRIKALTHIFTIDKPSAEILYKHGVEKVTIAGDTRGDRVIENAKQDFENEKISTFVSGKDKIIVCGSTWPEDEKHLVAMQQSSGKKYAIIFAPHDVGRAHIQSLKQKSGGRLYSEYRPGEAADMLIIDTIGLLKYIYGYAWVTYVGGAFKQGLHNVLEPAAYGRPVIFGPDIARYPEAGMLLDAGAAFSIKDAAGLQQVLANLERQEIYKKSSLAAKKFIGEQEGATIKIYEALGIRL